LVDLKASRDVVAGFGRGDDEQEEEESGSHQHVDDNGDRVRCCFRGRLVFVRRRICERGGSGSRLLDISKASDRDLWNPPVT